MRCLHQSATEHKVEENYFCLESGIILIHCRVLEINGHILLIINGSFWSSNIEKSSTLHPSPFLMNLVVKCNFLFFFYDAGHWKIDGGPQMSPGLQFGHHWAMYIMSGRTKYRQEVLSILFRRGHICIVYVNYYQRQTCRSPLSCCSEGLISGKVCTWSWIFPPSSDLSAPQSSPIQVLRVSIQLADRLTQRRQRLLHVNILTHWLCG